MNTLLKTVASTLLIACAPATFAASTVDLTVTGLITPNSCTPTLSGGGQVDYGKISAKDLKTNNPTHLGSQTLQMTVNCDAPIQFALNAIDNRPGTAAFSNRYGLGLINGSQPFGGYNLILRSPVADTVAVQPIASYDKGTTWGAEYIWEPGLYMSVGAMSDDTQPLPVQNLTVDLQVETSIARTDGLDLSNEVLIDGSATLEVKYL